MTRSKGRKAAKPRASVAKRASLSNQPARKTERGADGRLHLALVVEPGSGKARLDLVRPVFVEDWQNRLTAAAANTAYAILSDELSLDSVARLGKAAMDSTSSLVSGLLSRTPPGSVACQARCDHCCYQSVGVTPPEAMAIFAHVLETRSTEELARLRTRLAAFVEKARGLSSEERISPDLPCPFLEDHACSIYEVRPLSCRGVNSLDADTCRRNLHDKVARQESIEGKQAGHLLIAPIRGFNAISAGLQLALAERFRLDMRPLDLALALDLLLSDLAERVARKAEEPSANDSSVLDRWLGGDSALSAARGGDAGRDAGRLELVGAARPPQGE